MIIVRYTKKPETNTGESRKSVEKYKELITADKVDIHKIREIT